jgi:hypothetical protein
MSPDAYGGKRAEKIGRSASFADETFGEVPNDRFSEAKNCRNDLLWPKFNIAMENG